MVYILHGHTSRRNLLLISDCYIRVCRSFKTYWQSSIYNSHAFPGYVLLLLEWSCYYYLEPNKGLLLQMLAAAIQYTSLIYAWLSGHLISKAIHITSYIKMLFMDVNAMRIARNSNYRSRNLNSAHHSQKCISRSNLMSHRNCCVTIVYHRIEFVMKILSIVAWNLSRGYRLSPHRICHVDIVYRRIIIVYCHIVIVYRRINVVTCSSSHSTTFRATIYISMDS